MPWQHAHMSVSSSMAIIKANGHPTHVHILKVEMLVVLISFLTALASLVAAQSPAGVCDLPQNAALPFCNTALTLDARLDDLMARVPIADMPKLLSHNASSCPAIGWEEYNWKNPSLHGISPGAGVHFRPPTPYATCFPQILSFASTFDKDLFFRVGVALGNEKRAFYNAGNAGLTYFSPCIDIYRDPRWGRGAETPGEDPHLNGQYAIEYTRGMQGDGQFLKTAVGCKHFAGYDVEADRFRFNAIINKQDMADTFLPPFKDCAMGGRAAGFMCSYNAINGIPGCAHKELLTTILREEWGFDGYVVIDNGAGKYMWIPGYHNYAANRTDAVRAMLDAGVDIELEENPDWEQLFPNYIPLALQEGLITQQMVETALRRAFRVQMRLGYFEKIDNRPHKDITHEQYVDTQEHKDLALEAARKSIVLLKNEGRLLPLNKNSYTGANNLALIGPHFNTSRWFLANTAPIVSKVWTPIESIRQYYVGEENTPFNLGCDIVGLDSADLDGAEQLAGQATTAQVVLFVGLSLQVEEETRDRENLTWPGLQRELIDRVLAAAARPVVVVLVTGGPVDLTDLKSHPNVGAIVYSGYIGQAGGRAIADVLFGAYNPSGRLTHTFYANDFVSRIPITDMAMRPNASTGNPGRTYRFYTGTPVYEFGFGLSYVTFDYQLEIPANLEELPVVKACSPSKADCGLTMYLTVTNNGEEGRDGDHSILQFLSPPNAGQQGRPLKYLTHFDHVYLQAGEQERLEICLNAEQFMLADENGDFGVVTGRWTLRIGEIIQFLDVL